MPTVKAKEHAQAVHETSYYKGWTTHVQWTTKGMQQEHN
jgi:hypothetical protein